MLPNQVLLSGMKTCPAGQRVQQHHMHPSQAWLSVPGGNQGLGDPQGSVLAALKYAPSRLIASQTPAGQWDASFCIEALEEAIARYGKPEIMNTPSRDIALQCPAGQ